MRVRLHRLVLGGLLAASSRTGAGVAIEACNSPGPSPPSPVIVTTPTTVCFGDDYMTPITLDGTQSTGMLGLVPTPSDAGAAPLEYVWTLTGSAYKIISGSLTTAKLVVEIAGDQPLQVDLDVNNGSASADITATVSVTLSPDASDGGCPLGNPG